jgi:hypothetical protein
MKKHLPPDNGSRQSPSTPDTGPHQVVTYRVWAIDAHGSRSAVDAHAIIVDIGGARLRVDLRSATPLLAGRLQVSVEGDGFLVLGPGDASAVNLSVLPFGAAEKASP